MPGSLEGASHHADTNAQLAMHHQASIAAPGSQWLHTHSSWNSAGDRPVEYTKRESCAYSADHTRPNSSRCLCVMSSFCTYKHAVAVLHRLFQMCSLLGSSRHEISAC